MIKKAQTCFMVGEMRTCTTLGKHNVSKTSQVCHDKIFAILFFESEYVLPLGERTDLSFGEVCGQGGIFMVWEYRGGLLVHTLPLWKG